MLFYMPWVQMKILLLSLNHAPERTGIGKYQGEMAAWLASRGHEVRVIAAPPYYPEWKVGAGYSAWRYKREDIDGATVYRVPIYVPANPTGVKRLVHLASFVGSSKPLAFWQAISWKPDVIFMTAPPLMAAPVVLIAGWLAKARTYLHVQDFEVDAAFQLGLLTKPWLYRAALKIESWLMRRFDGVGTISRNMLRKLSEKGVPEDRTFLIPNWANTEVFETSVDGGRFKEAFKKNPATILVLYSGNLGRKQGLETIVDAAKLLSGQDHIHFVISGDGAGKADMQASAAGLSNITFLPVQPMDEFANLMSVADIHILPQKAEAADLVMPSKLGNMLASGRPVVACAASGTQVYDAVQGCGIAVPPEEPKAMADAISLLAGDAALRASMGEQGRKRARNEWSRQAILERLEAKLAGK